MKTKLVQKYIVSGDPKVDIVYHNLEWVITALTGTLVFIVFVMQVYRIPTGSMAETLRGSHFRLCCPQCGQRYDYEFYPQLFGLKENTVPKFDLPVIPSSPRCPSCGWFADTGSQSRTDKKFYTSEGKPATQRPISRGDQIFVLKCIYQFFEPKRWDVVVFKNPIQPQINYIKRLIALPGEKVEIIDGDIYINDQIVRKPDKVQEEEWMCIYNNDYIPAHPEQTRFNFHAWKQPFEAVDGAAWNLESDGPTVFSLKGGKPEQMQVVRYNPLVGNDFRAVYAYDPSSLIPSMPICSDLKMQYYANIAADGAAGIRLGKYGIRYEGLVYADGRMVISRMDNGIPVELIGETVAPSADSEIRLLQFANVDHKLVLEYGNHKIEYDLGRDKKAMGTDRSSVPTAEIVGFGSLELRHIKLMRDVHYIGSESTAVIRAGEGNPLALNQDEFFVCGDNSPNSYDARMWKEPTLANPGQQYRDGVVPRDYMVGKAFFVHFPGSWRFGNPKFRQIPYLDGAPEPDGMKIIYGGRD